MSTLGTGTTALGTTTLGATTITSPPSGGGVVGVPFTGGGPPQSRAFPWLPLLLAGIVATAGTVGVVLRRRVHLRHAMRELN
jgi:hypothetical protein